MAGIVALGRNLCPIRARRRRNQERGGCRATMNQKTALISVYHKEGIGQFAAELVKLGWQMLSSGGTAKHLRENGIEVRDIAAIVGEPILGHRVVTLSRQIHAALLARGRPEVRAVLDPDG